jgi:hypothetical protein
MFLMTLTSDLSIAALFLKDPDTFYRSRDRVEECVGTSGGSSLGRLPVKEGGMLQACRFGCNDAWILGCKEPWRLEAQILEP